MMNVRQKVGLGIVGLGVLGVLSAICSGAYNRAQQITLVERYVADGRGDMRFATDLAVCLKMESIWIPRSFTGPCGHLLGKKYGDLWIVRADTVLQEALSRENAQ